MGYIHIMPNVKYHGLTKRAHGQCTLLCAQTGRWVDICNLPHLTSCLHYHNLEQDIAHQHTCPVQNLVSASFKHVWLHISGQAAFLPSRKRNRDEFCWQTKSVVDIFRSDFRCCILCNYRLTLHHVAFENFPHKVNWVGAFWSEL